jgi:Zn-dependent peptidase ImmA (M78 family)
MAATGVPVRPEALRWVMRRAAIVEKDLAKAVKVKPEKVLAWLEGREKPTYKQAKELANRLHIAFSQLLVPPPTERVELPLKDFRRGQARREEASPELVEAIHDALRKRDWWRQIRRNEPLPFVRSQSWKDSTPEAVVDSILKFIPIRRLQEETPSWGEFLKQTVEKVEEAGVLVLRQGYAGSNTRRVYNPKEFSGFAITDSVAPVIFLNTRDPVARQVFTLAHELVHVWIGESVLDAALESPEVPEEQVERFCDQAAAALLMPEETFRSTWNGVPYEAAQQAARRFKVSVWATLRRARELALISQEEYATALERAQENTERKEQSERSANFWRILEVRNSKRFTRTVVALARQGEISAKEVASLLNISLSTALDLMERASNVSTRF